MYAIIETGSKQYRAEAGKTLRVEKLDRKLGEQFDLEDVLFVGGEKPLVGTPNVKGAKVTVVVTQQDRASKILIFKKKIRQNYRRLNGHRQPYTQLFVVSITAGGETVKADAKPVVVDPMKKIERLEAQEAKMQTLSKEERAAKKAKQTAKAKKKVAKKTTSAKKKTAKKAAKKTSSGKKKKATKKK